MSRSVILPTDIPGLTFLPAGTASENATELLASERMAADRRRSCRHGSGAESCCSIRCRMLLTSESRVLATLVGQIVLVVKAGVTPQQAVADALSASARARRCGWCSTRPS